MYVVLLAILRIGCDSANAVADLFFDFMDVLRLAFVRARGDSATVVAQLISFALERRDAGQSAAGHELLLEAVAMTRRIDGATAGADILLIMGAIHQAVISAIALGLAEQALALEHEACPVEQAACRVARCCLLWCVTTFFPRDISQQRTVQPDDLDAPLFTDNE